MLILTLQADQPDTEQSGPEMQLLGFRPEYAPRLVAFRNMLQLSDRRQLSLGLQNARTSPPEPFFRSMHISDFRHHLILGRRGLLLQQNALYARCRRSSGTVVRASN